MRLSPDAYLLSDELTPREVALTTRVRGFVEDSLLPIINAAWEAGRFPEELIPAIAKLGIVGGVIAGYGCPGLTVARAGTRGHGDVEGRRQRQHVPRACTPVSRWARSICWATRRRGSGGCRRWRASRSSGAFALTEPEHGSDSVDLSTSARRDGDDFVLNGAKRWIGNAHRADVVVVWARDEADRRVKAFVVERNDEGAFPSGFSPVIIEGKIGKRAIEQSDISLENVRIPVSNLLAGSTSFRDASRVLARTRAGASWEAIGHAMASYDAAVAYTKQRVQFGRPVAEFQLVQHRLAKMLAAITAMQLYCFRLAELAESGRLEGGMSALAKMFTAERARWVCSEARDLLGGNGMLLENHVARHLTDMEVVYTYEGTDTIQSLIVGRDIVGVPAFRG